MLCKAKLLIWLKKKQQKIDLHFMNNFKSNLKIASIKLKN